MPVVESPQLQELVVDKLIVTGRIKPEERTAYIEIGSLVYRGDWCDFQMGVRVPVVRANQPEIMRYLNRLARTIGLGGRPSHAIYLSVSESEVLLRGIQLEWPSLYRGLTSQLNVR